MEQATERQVDLMLKLSKLSEKEAKSFSKEAANRMIQKLIEESKNGKEETKDYSKEKYSISFMSMVKARLAYYAELNTNISMEEVINEIKKAY